MTLSIVCRNMWDLRSIIMRHSRTISRHTATTNIYNIKSVKEAPILRNEFNWLLIPRRNFFGMFKRPNKAQLRIIDDVPDQYNLIYRSRMDRYILYTQIFTSTTAFIVFLTAIIKYDFSKGSDWLTPSSPPDNEIMIYLTSFVILIVILQLMISRLPIRIYNLPRQKKYIFIFHGNFPLSYRRVTCKVGDVTPLPETGISPWRQGRYKIKDTQKIIIFDQYFRRPADLYIMLGVQRDPDVDEKN